MPYPNSHNMLSTHQLIEEFAVPSGIHPGESVHVRIRRDLAFRPGCRLNGNYLVDLHVGASCRFAENYAGLSLRAANEVALRYLLEHVDGIRPGCIDVCGFSASLISCIKGPLQPTREVARQVRLGLATAR
jgi:hypothetical protein